MSFQQGLSGLNSSSKALDVIGNNVANANTVGFKSAETHFADVYANSLSGGGASQVGIGSTISGVQQQFSQGNVTTTNNPLDISINGGGFFRMDQNGSVSYTRNGQFHLDNAGYIVNDQQLRVMGYPADATGLISASSPVDLQLSASQIQPRATSDTLAGNITGQLNLDSRQGVPTAAGPTAAAQRAASIVAAAATAAAALGGATAASVNAAALAAVAGATTTGAAVAGGSSSASSAAAAAAAAVAAASTGASAAAAAAAATAAVAPYTAAAATAATFNYANPLTYNYSTALSVYDTLGVAHSVTLFFSRTAAGPWDVNATMDGATPQSLGTMTFDTSGNLTTAMPVAMPSWALTTGAATPWSPGNIDFAGTTQYGSASSVNRLTQGGYTTGSLTGLNVGSDGVVQGRYSNGQTRNLGQIVLATFANPNGLKSLGNNQWSLSPDSGPELVSAPGTGGRGVLQSASIEESNVDLTGELVKMITQQRNYQANAQSIKTQDQIMQTLVNLR
jgi:flagellar hook protein FlgE